MTTNHRDGLKKLAIRATLKSLGMKVPSKLDDTNWGITYEEALRLWQEAFDTLSRLPDVDPARAYFEASKDKLFHLAKLLYVPASKKEEQMLVYYFKVPYATDVTTRKFLKQIAAEVNALHWDYAHNHAIGHQIVLLQPTELTKLQELQEWVSILSPALGMERVPKEIVGIEDREMG